MQHSVVDAHAATRRARSNYVEGWHPLLSTVEVQPGEWHLVTAYGKHYAVIVLLEIGGERGYRAVTWAPVSEDRKLIGYYTSLRVAAEKAHRRWVASLAPDGFAPSPWPS